MMVKFCYFPFTISEILYLAKSFAKSALVIFPFFSSGLISDFSGFSFWVSFGAVLGTSFVFWALFSLLTVRGTIGGSHKILLKSLVSSWKINYIYQHSKSLKNRSISVKFWFAKNYLIRAEMFTSSNNSKFENQHINSKFVMSKNEILFFSHQCSLKDLCFPSLIEENQNEAGVNEMWQPDFTVHFRQ